jgi:hypothetical protein
VISFSIKRNRADDDRYGDRVHDAAHHGLSSSALEIESLPWPGRGHARSTVSSVTFDVAEAPHVLHFALILNPARDTGVLDSFPSPYERG